MYCLATQIVRSVEGYSARVRHNFNRAVRVSRDFASKAGPEMQDQIRFSGSTQDLCPCGSSLHYTKMYGVDIP
jgi:hypothetical protein